MNWIMTELASAISRLREYGMIYSPNRILIKTITVLALNWATSMTMDMTMPQISTPSFVLMHKEILTYILLS